MDVSLQGVQIPYMGSKRSLAPLIGQIIAGLSKGPCLDLFAGMCSLAGSLAEMGIPVWSNDIQVYSNLVAECMTRSLTPPPTSASAANLLQHCYLENLGKLQHRFAKAVDEERLALRSSNYLELRAIQENWSHAANNPKVAAEVKGVRLQSSAFPYRLVTLTFAHGYFGLLQATEIDSIKYAVDRALLCSEINLEEYRWLILALLQATSHLSASPGHFAEFLKPHDEKVFARISRLRKRSVWQQFMIELDRLEVFGGQQWRAKNRVFSSESISLLRQLAQESVRPAVIYSDPPYSRAQYSRYYHVLETLVRYDYPDSNGTGRYRSGRFQTPFSNAGTVLDAFCSLLGHARSVGAAMVISYPSNGLLFRAGFDLKRIMERYFRSIKTITVERAHSTLGGSPGRERYPVEELVYIGKN